MVRYHLLVHGKVQGVGFRYHIQLHATLNNIKGWVKNNSDGSVEVDAEGTEESMKKFMAAVQKGNPYSRIDSVDISRLDEISNYKSFRITY